MKISKVRILNILGIDELEFEPGKHLTEIIGGNNKNKSNVLNALKSVFEGGHDATLLHAGAEKGEAVFLLDDGTNVRKSVTAAKSTLTIERDGAPVPSPQTTLRALADVFSVNPIKFLTAPDSDRAQILLESMPLPLDREHLEKIAEIKLPEYQPGTSPLVIIDDTLDAVFDTRTGVHRILEDKKGTVKQLTEALPPMEENTPEDVNLTEAELDAKIDEFAARQETELAEAEGAMMRWQNGQEAVISEMDTEIQALVIQIEELRSQMDAKRQEITQVKTGIQAVRGRCEARKAALRDTIAAERKPYETQRNQLRANRVMAAKRQNTIEAIQAHQADIAIKQGEWDHLTSVVEAIRAYKLELLSKLPIKDLHVVKGKVMRGNVPFDKLNTAQRMDIAMELAQLRAKDLPLVLVDGLEALDPDAYESFREKAQNSPLQFIVTKVDRGNMRINNKP